MKKYIILVFCILMLLQTASVSAATNSFLNDDPNYPWAYGHGGGDEYVQLDSCRIDHVNGLDVYISANVIYTFNKKVEDKWRQYWKLHRSCNGNPRFNDLSYCNHKTGKWEHIPYYKSRQFIGDYMDVFGFGTFVMTFHAMEYYPFKVAYRQVYGKVYPDGLSDNELE